MALTLNEKEPVKVSDPNVVQVQPVLSEIVLEGREKRNQLLADSDWTQMNDSPLNNEAKTAWATYRQSLRDLPTEEGWPFVDFPDTP